MHWTSVLVIAIPVVLLALLVELAYAVCGRRWLAWLLATAVWVAFGVIWHAPQWLQHIRPSGLDYYSGMFLGLLAGRAISRAVAAVRHRTPA